MSFRDGASAPDPESRDSQVRNCAPWFASARRPGMTSSVHSEAIEQAVTAGALEVILRAAAVRSARGMRRVPRLRRIVVAQALAVGMANHGRALRAARPVLAGAVGLRRKRRAVRLRPRQHVVAIGRIAAAVNDVALFRQRGLLGEIVAGAVQVGNVLGDDDTLGVLPRPFADPVLCVDRGLAVRGLGREIGMPGLGSGAGRLRQRLAVLVGAVDAAEIGALARAGAGQEEAGTARLRLRGLYSEGRERVRRDEANA